MKYILSLMYNGQNTKSITTHYTYKKLNCTGICVQSLHFIFWFMNSWSLSIYLEGKCKQQMSRRELKYQYKCTYVSNQEKLKFVNLVTSILFSSVIPTQTKLELKGQQRRWNIFVYFDQRTKGCCIHHSLGEIFF